MSIITLSREEREKFAAWLEQEAESDDLMAKQADTLGSHAEPVARMLRNRAFAYAVVAKTLRGIEDYSVGERRDLCN